MDVFPNFKDYLNRMRKDGSWGDVLTFMVISHFTLRLIRVVPDNLSSPELFVPRPNFIDKIVWGPKFY